MISIYQAKNVESILKLNAILHVQVVMNLVMKLIIIVLHASQIIIFWMGPQIATKV